MNKTNTSLRENLSDDQLCAMVARNEIRKMGLSVADSPHRFLGVFHDYADAPKGKSEKQTAELEKQRKAKLNHYVDEYLAVKNFDGTPTNTIVTE